MNERLLDEIETLKAENHSLKVWIDDYGEPITTNCAPEASTVTRSRESESDDALDVCVELNNKRTLGCSAQSTVIR